MPTTTNYGWTTPADTDLVKDGASAIRTLGTSIDTTTKNLNPSTTLGDIEYRSSTANTNTRLAIGTTGQVLTVSGGVPAWANAAGGANWSLLNSGGTALTGAATITVSGISSVDKIMVLVDGASSANTEAIIKVRLNTDTGSNYYNYGQRFIWPTTYDASTFTSQVGADDGIYLGRVGQNAGSAVSGYALFSGCNSSGVKVFNAAGAATPSGSVQHIFYTLGGYYNSASTISSVSIFSASGNFDAGTVYIYTSA